MMLGRFFRSIGGAGGVACSLEWLIDIVSHSASINDAIDSLRHALTRIGANEKNIKQYLSDSVNLLEKNTSMLRAEFEKSFLDLVVNKDCFKKNAEVLTSISHKDADLKKFVDDVNSLDQFLNEIRPTFKIKDEREHPGDDASRLTAKL